jgi:hypothetical protein
MKINFKHTVCCLIIFISCRLLYEKHYLLLYFYNNLHLFQLLISSKILYGKEGGWAAIIRSSFFLNVRKQYEHCI